MRGRFSHYLTEVTDILADIRVLVALGWVAAGFLYELGVSWEWVEIQLLAQLGGWEKRQNRPPGKFVIARGLRRLPDTMAVEAVLNDHIATLLGRD